MTDLPEDALYTGIEVDFEFTEPRPMFGDLFAICGFENPNFPPSGNVDFTGLADLQFSQVDDYFGIRTLSGEGGDVAAWLYPVVGGDPVDHDPGPFDAVRLSFNVLRHPKHRAEYFIHVLEEFLDKLDVTLNYRTRDGKGGIKEIKHDIQTIAQYWESEGITPGSDEALEVDY